MSRHRHQQQRRARTHAERVAREHARWWRTVGRYREEARRRREVALDRAFARLILQQSGFAGMVWELREVHVPEPTAHVVLPSGGYHFRWASGHVDPAPALDQLTEDQVRAAYVRSHLP